MNVELDAGANVTALLEKLAQQIGTTAEQVFPWYVKQQIIEGYTFLILSVSLIIFGALTFRLTFKKADWNGNAFNIYTFINGGCVIAVVLSFIILMANFVNIISSIMNPEFAAMQEIMHSLAKLNS